MYGVWNITKDLGYGQNLLDCQTMPAYGMTGIMLHEKLPQKPIYSIKELVQLLETTRQTLGRYWRQGTGPARTRIGGRVWVTDESLRAWLRANTEQGGRDE